MVGVNESLNLYQLFVNDIASGDVLIFLVLSMILITLMLAQMRVPNFVTIAILLLYGLMMGVFFEQILVVVLVIIAIILTITILKLFNN